MTRYLIENIQSGIILGVYEAETMDDALDLMSVDAGYHNYLEACTFEPSDALGVAAKRGELAVTKIDDAE